jgi:hypothetical protein
MGQNPEGFRTAAKRETMKTPPIPLPTPIPNPINGNPGKNKKSDLPICSPIKKGMVGTANGSHGEGRLLGKMLIDTHWSNP